MTLTNISSYWQHAARAEGPHLRLYIEYIIFNLIGPYQVFERAFPNGRIRFSLNDQSQNPNFRSKSIKQSYNNIIIFFFRRQF